MSRPDESLWWELMEAVETGRDAHRRRAWADAYDALSEADRGVPLAPSDLELLATSAYLAGRELEALSAFERAHQAHLDSNQPTRAARCAFWVGLFLLLRNEIGRATAWLARAHRLVDQQPDEPVERGYLLVPKAEKELACANWEAAHETASLAAEFGERFSDPDLLACARHLQGRARLMQGCLDEGLALLDEAMLPATEGELSPVLTGLVYCSVIDACLQVQELSRAREWTHALACWCANQPQLVAFTGSCLVHRVQILQLNGGWQSALSEILGACDRFSRGVGREPPGPVLYERGELHRLRGEREAAEQAYREASRLGCEPQPGLALLRLAEGRVDAALAGLGLVVGATNDRLQRSRLLPAWVEVLLAAKDMARARAACEELSAICETHPSEALTAITAQAHASLALADGDPSLAVRNARTAWEMWTRIDAPYCVARSRELIALACLALGDEDGARLQLEAARSSFEQLGAEPDRARVASSLQSLGTGAKQAPPGAGQLTARELEVIRLLASGKTNKAIAAELGLSEKTIERHVGNIFDKLDVPSRSAATAYAYQHKLI